MRGGRLFPEKSLKCCLLRDVGPLNGLLLSLIRVLSPNFAKSQRRFNRIEVSLKPTKHKYLYLLGRWSCPTRCSHFIEPIASLGSFTQALHKVKRQNSYQGQYNSLKGLSTLNGWTLWKLTKEPYWYNNTLITRLKSLSHIFERHVDKMKT